MKQTSYLFSFLVLFNLGVTTHPGFMKSGGTDLGKITSGAKAVQKVSERDTRQTISEPEIFFKNPALRRTFKNSASFNLLADTA
jgi:hypothetical protein